MGNKDDEKVTTTEAVYERSERRETDQDYLKSAHAFAMKVAAMQDKRKESKK